MATCLERSDVKGTMVFLSMKKLLYSILLLIATVSCVGQKDDPEDLPTPGGEPVEEPADGPEGGAYFRRSLVLDFTGTWCVNCPKMEAAIKEAQAQRSGRIACVSVHCLAVDNLALLPESGELATRFGVTAYPSAVVDLDPASLITVSSPELLLSHADRLLEQRPEAAGLKITGSLSGGVLTASLEAEVVRDGSYSFSLIVVEDGVVASQTGGSADYVHGNVLRAWKDSEVFPSCKAGDTLAWTVEAKASEGQRIVALICREGIVDNVALCPAGGSVGYQYEE